MIRNRIKKFREYSDLTDLGALSRRYFIIGTFDGALTILALIIGAYASSASGDLIFAAGLAMGIGLGVSSFFGAYESERIERRIELKKLERQMLTKMKGTIHEDATKFAILWSSFVHGISPMIASWIPIIPFLFLDVKSAMFTAVIIAFLILFITGMYLGRTGKKGMITYGLRFLFIGVITAVFIAFISALH
jgi:predicted membrane protein (TIGR00267 family)